MFVKLGKSTWVNLENIVEIKLIDKNDKNKCYWEFVTNNVTIKIWFNTKEEAIEWFKKNVEPILNDYNNAKFATVDLNHLYDISKTLKDLVDSKQL